jgi:pyruvate,water dikinase
MPKQSYKAIIGGLKTYYRNDKAEVPRYFERMEKSIAQIEAEINNYHRGDLVRYICNDMKTKMADAVYDTTCYGIIMGGVIAMSYINKMGKKLLGEKDYVNQIGKSIPNNVTSEMGILLGNIADAIRDDPEKISYLKNGGTVLPELDEFMKKYGCRCPGEIDLCKTRYIEQPENVISILLANLTQPKGYAQAMYQKGLEESQVAIAALLEKAPRNKKLKKNIDFYRHFFGLREAPKYYWIRRYWVYKKALMEEAARLKIRNIDDIYYMSVAELEAAFDGETIDFAKIDTLKAAFAGYEKLTPPRLIFSDGEVVETHYDNPAPEGALRGIGVSNGVVEGKARVVTDVINAKDIQTGEILVTHFTDPSWTPVFLSIKALVAEVGGMVTHGSVIAREYGLPAVVAVNSATQLIKTGDLIRVSGDEGWVEILK